MKKFNIEIVFKKGPSFGCNGIAAENQAVAIETAKRLAQFNSYDISKAKKIIASEVK